MLSAVTPGQQPPSAHSSDSRLYVGNLSPSVDEFALVALFSKFGKISKLDFLFHKSGVLRGKPRGYAFIEMSRRDEALKAMIELNNKPVRGRRILVTPANESQYQEHQAANQAKPNHQHRNSSTAHDGRPGQRGRGAVTDPMRPTTLSILKSQQQPKGVNNKIAALEAKLASMQQIGSASASSSDAPLASSSSSTTKPAFLPQTPQNLPHRPQRSHPAHPFVSVSSAKPASVKKPSKLTTTAYGGVKNPPNLDAIGLTLKEQLKRNRQSHPTALSTAKHTNHVVAPTSLGKLSSPEAPISAVVGPIQAVVPVDESSSLSTEALQVGPEKRPPIVDCVASEQFDESQEPKKRKLNGPSQAESSEPSPDAIM